MAGTNKICRRSTAAVAAVGFLFFAGLAPSRAAGLDPAQMSAEGIKALQHRLTDAGCYKGAIDGAPSVALDEAIKVCPDQRPFLRIEIGMHTAPPIRAIGVDAECRVLATGANDKTVRIWSMPDGKLQRVIRWPIGEGDAGEVFSMALSLDGRWLAIGGRDAAFYRLSKHSLTLVDLLTGAIQRFGAYEEGINRIAFSGDGRRIAVGLSGNNGVLVLDSASGAELHADRDYGDAVRGLAFAREGSLIASSNDGQLRRYGPDLKLAVKVAAPDGKRPSGIAIEPSGHSVAVGYGDTTAVSILDATTLSPLAEGQTHDIGKGTFSSVAWSRDGATLVAGGNAAVQIEGQWRQFLRRFDATGRRKDADIAASSNSITDVQPCGDGFVFSTFEPSFGVLSAQGRETILRSQGTVEMIGKLGAAFAVSADASSVRFGLGFGAQRPVAFDLSTGSLTDSPSLPSGFSPVKIDGLPVTDWLTPEPKFNGAPLDLLKSGGGGLSMAVRPDATGFAIGARPSIFAFDAKGQLRWQRVVPAPARGVTFSGDGEILLAACRDGTIRWLRWSDGEELLALFVEPQTRRWVAWTPSGYYMASAGGEDLIGWHVNRGWSQEADFFPASQFRAEYNRPDIVRLVLQTKDEAEAIRRANAVAKRAAQPIALALPPILTIASPADGSHFSGDSIKIAYSLRSPSGLPIDRLDVLADGLPIKATGFAPMKGPEATGNVIAEPPKKDAAISLIAYSGGLSSAPVGVKLVYDRPIAMAPPDPRPKLYALLIGVTGYQNPDYNNIRYSAHDADELAQALMAQKGGLYADVEAKVVDDPGRPDADPTRSNVEEGLYWLQHTATNRDLSVVFLSGHGFLDPKQKFWFLTREADIDRLRTTAISNDDLLDLIDSIPGKKILFVDACHSGAAMVVGYKATPSETTPDMNKVVNDFSTAGSGVVVFAASTGTELAKEDEKWDRHGAFAKALIEAIGEGKAAIEARKPITTDLLDYYVVERVKQLTDGKQHPVMHRPDLVPDFPLALAKP
jgi:WD40 repeat protein